MPKDITQREFERVPYTEYVVINGTLRVKAIDLSEGGLYVHTGRSIIDGSVVEVTMPAVYEPIKVKARVQFHQEGVGMGLRFVDLTREKYEAITAQIELCRAKASLASGAGTKTVLMVDFNPLSVKMFKSEFTLHGYNVICPPIAEGVLAALGQEPMPDVVFCGLNADKTWDFKVFLAVMEKAKPLGLPVLVVSPYTQKDTIRRVINAGAAEFMDRTSASPKKVVSMVELLLSRKNKT